MLKSSYGFSKLVAQPVINKTRQEYPISLKDISADGNYFQNPQRRNKARGLLGNSQTRAVAKKKPEEVQSAVDASLVEGRFDR